jgi:TolB-like protein/two-component SAPR family response regulator/Tfp pilus assembly protein PilF
VADRFTVKCGQTLDAPQSKPDMNVVWGRGQVSSLHIKLLGAFEVRDALGKPLPPLRRQAQAVLAVLALRPGTALSRDKLTTMLWSERGEIQARNSLRHVLSDLRKAFIDLNPSPLITDRMIAHLDSEIVEVDVVAFERLTDEGTPDSLERASELYQGEFLEDLGVRNPVFVDWMRDERNRLHNRARAALSCLLEHRMAARQTDKAVATAERLLLHDPTHEGGHRALMRIYTDKGDRALGVKQYQICCDALRAELGIEPEAETQRLHEEIRQMPVREGPAAYLSNGKHTGLALPDRPSVAVLPFVNMSGDGEQEYFSDGITEDIITDLSRFRSLFVIARDSSFTYKGKSAKVQEVGRDLGVQFVLEGSVRHAGNKIRVTAQLLDATTGYHVWAEHYDRELEDIFEVQDEITEMIVSTLAGRIDDAMLERTKRKSPGSLEAYDYVLRGDENLWLYGGGKWLDTKDKIARSRQNYLKAIELDPTYARAYEGVAYTYLTDWGFLLGQSPEEDLSRASEYAQKAVAIDDANNRAHHTLALTHVFSKNYEQARLHKSKAVTLNPNDADYLIRACYLLPLLDEHEDAIELGERALRLNPFHPTWYLTFLAFAYFTGRRYSEAITAFESAHDAYPDDAAELAACYAQSGQLDKARSLLSDFLRSAGPEPWWMNVPESAPHVERDPTGLLRYMVYMFPFKNPSDLDHLLDGLRKAGLPE